MLTVNVSVWNDMVFTLANFFECDVEEILALGEREIERLYWMLQVRRIREQIEG